MVTEKKRIFKKREDGEEVARPRFMNSNSTGERPKRFMNSASAQEPEMRKPVEKEEREEKQRTEPTDNKQWSKDAELAEGKLEWGNVFKQ